MKIMGTAGMPVRFGSNAPADEPLAPDVEEKVKALATKYQVPDFRLIADYKSFQKKNADKSVDDVLALIETRLAERARTPFKLC